MRTIKETVAFAKETIQESMIQANSVDVSARAEKLASSKIVRFASRALPVVALTGMMSMRAYAAVDLFDNVETFAKNLTARVRGITTTLAILAIIICALMYMFGSQRSTENAKAWGIRILVAYFVILAASYIVDTVKTVSGM